MQANTLNSKSVIVRVDISVFMYCSGCPTDLICLMLDGDACVFAKAAGILDMTAFKNKQLIRVVSTRSFNVSLISSGPAMLDSQRHGCFMVIDV